MSMIFIAPIMMSFSNPSVPKPASPGFKYVGDIRPTGYFDPLNLSTEKNVRFLREAELQHGRAAMIASTAIPLYELMDHDGLGINMLSSENFQDQLPFWYGMAALEFYRMYTGWNSPFYGENRKLFTLRDDYQPGNLLRLNPESIPDRKYNSELSNGRLAMLAAAHIVGSELFTQHRLF